MGGYRIIYNRSAINSIYKLFDCQFSLLLNLCNARIVLLKTLIYCRMAQEDAVTAGM